jgi:hypothetical protein
MGDNDFNHSGAAGINLGRRCTALGFWGKILKIDKINTFFLVRS